MSKKVADKDIKEILQKEEFTDKDRIKLYDYTKDFLGDSRLGRMFELYGKGQISTEQKSRLEIAINKELEKLPGDIKDQMKTSSNRCGNWGIVGAVVFLVLKYKEGGYQDQLNNFKNMSHVFSFNGLGGTFGKMPFFQIENQDNQNNSSNKPNGKEC
ncbi:hypothetical protein L3V83_11200 [Thiotrichales bacterium 19X7-9]|nr:hypothetical protein [Thiotrichales bacterium 19X7-9]